MPPLQAFKNFTKAPDNAQVGNHEFRRFVDMYSGKLNPVLFNINFFNEFRVVFSKQYIYMDREELGILSKIIDGLKLTKLPLKDFLSSNFPNFGDILNNETATINKFIEEVKNIANRHYIPERITKKPEPFEQ